MHSTKIDIFFSCSFASDDEDINKYFLSICRGLGFSPGNVSTASTSTPPDVARSKIGAAQALVAICTRRDEMKAGGFQMPQAVQDEISIAYGLSTPILMFVEDGVKIAGFKGNLCSYLPFKRNDLAHPDTIQKAIEALHGLRLQLTGLGEIGAVGGMMEAHAEYVRHLVELIKDGDNFRWEYTTSKKMVFSHPCKRPITASSWCSPAVMIPDGAPNIEWSVRLDASSRNIRLVPKIERQDPRCVEALIHFEPTPEEDDFVEYTTSVSSKYLNPIWANEAQSQSSVHLSKGNFKCAEGLVFIHRTKCSIIEFRFAKEYGLCPEDVVPYVGSYTSTLDYEVESELKRMVIRYDQFGGHLSVRIEVESPLPGHMYGLAWNPRSPSFPSDPGSDAQTPSGATE